MGTVKEAAVDIGAVRTACTQWTRFEEFPRFMEGVEEVRHLDDRHNHWNTRSAGRSWLGHLTSREAKVHVRLVAELFWPGR